MMNLDTALEALQYDDELIEEVNSILSSALIAVVKKDVDGLKALKEEVEELCENWCEYPDNPSTLEYYQAINYFIKRLEKEKV